MPYPPEHKRRTRARIVECARALFNRRGFTEVSIDEIMAAAGLTRGGFYNHFKTKDELYAEALSAFAAGGREKSCDSASHCGPEVARQVFNLYVSRQHLENLDGQCPLVALPSDAARAGPAVRAAYQGVFEVLVGMFEANLQPDNGASARQQGLAIAATCVGAMVLARTVDDAELADEICEAARAFASDAIG
jgi:AcrR family transcriptional regulator